MFDGSALARQLRALICILFNLRDPLRPKPPPVRIVLDPPQPKRRP